MATTTLQRLDRILASLHGASNLRDELLAIRADVLSFGQTLDDIQIHVGQISTHHNLTLRAVLEELKDGDKKSRKRMADALETVLGTKP